MTDEIVPSTEPVCYEHAKGFPLFADLGSDRLGQLVSDKALQHYQIARDVVIPNSGNDPYGKQQATPKLIFVESGQLAIGLFNEKELLAQNVVKREKAEADKNLHALLIPDPLARLAKKNLASFLTGDLCKPDAINRTMVKAGHVMELYSAAPASYFAMSVSAAVRLSSQFPSFAQRLQRAVTAGAERLSHLEGVKQEVFDFFVRHGISVAGPMVRVRQLDLCIDCKLCEIACEERYGAKRLVLGGYQLGMLDFVYTCRTCTDQRCIDPCEYDSISYDAKRGEVVINESSCVGCTACAQACPYEAITMVDVEDPSNPSYEDGFRLRLEKEGSLKAGPGTPRVARARRIANKCDHCMNYGEQACVSACPTGSLIELDVYELFRERTKSMKKVARRGYVAELPKKSRKELLPAVPFTEGIGVRDSGIARVRRARYAGILFWAVGLAAFLLAAAEVLLRTYKPEMSFAFSQISADPRYAGLASAKLAELAAYREGTELSLWCGYIGTGLMAVAAIYPMFRRFQAFRVLASNTMWFDFHMMAGAIGPMFIVLHCALSLDTWVAAAFWSMVIVVVSGVIGRYLYTQVPELLNGRELEDLDHQRAVASLQATQPTLYRLVKSEINEHDANAELVAERVGLLHAFLWVIAEDVRRPFRWLSRRRRYQQAGIPKRMARTFSHVVGRTLLAHRRKVLAPRAQLILHSWKKVHVPFTIVLVAISAVHIWAAFKYSM